jgi:nicotinamidase/pyrazinamidase
MDPKSTVFFDVDTQRDFLLPDGKLYVAGADRIIPNLAAITNLARQLRIRIIASTDCHYSDDPELQRNGGAYPDHCMADTAGQKKIEATALFDPLYIPNKDLGADEITAALTHRGEIVIEKQLFDVFAGNRNTSKLLPMLLKDCRDVVVYGVYTEVCVRDAITGLRQYPVQTHVLVDAIADIGAEGERYRTQWQAEGVELLTVDELKARLS